MNRRDFLVIAACVPACVAYAKTDTANSRISFSGEAKAQFILGMQGTLTGHASFVSSTDKFDLNMTFGAINYHHERFTLDGPNIVVDTVKPGTRSPLGDFIFRRQNIIKGGIFGGVFNAYWQEPKKRTQTIGDMTIGIDIDSRTNRHTNTTYRVFNAHDLTTGGGDTYYTLIETFRDFRPVDGRVLPHVWMIEYTIDAERQDDFIGQWTINITNWRNN